MDSLSQYYVPGARSEISRYHRLKIDLEFDGRGSVFATDITRCCPHGHSIKVAEIYHFHHYWMSVRNSDSIQVEEPGNEVIDLKVNLAKH
uniref:Uncharacterized protein n=1 Tax=Salix viminalis TaxID=40686 RepID=A0A6N2NI70_SALVM